MSELTKALEIIAQKMVEEYCKQPGKPAVIVVAQILSETSKQLDEENPE